VGIFAACCKLLSTLGIALRHVNPFIYAELPHDKLRVSPTRQSETARDHWIINTDNGRETCFSPADVAFPSALTGVTSGKAYDVRYNSVTTCWT
jgi:hypothetical protein